MPGFRVQAARFFLTVPKCPLEKEDALAQWKQAFGAEITEYIVCRELHEDGDPHLHAYLRYKRKVNCTNPKSFNLKAEDGTEYQVNIQACRSSKAVKEYVAKDGDYIESDEANAEDVWSKAMGLAKKRKYDDAVSLLEKEKPKDMLTRGVEIRKNLRGSAPSHVYAQPDGELPFVLPDDVSAVIPSMFGKKAIILSGKSGVGKTRFARSLGPHHFVTHMDQLRSLVAGRLLVFDDMSFAHMPRESIIQLVDSEQERAVHARYSNGFIAAKTPKIFLTNRTCPEELFGEVAGADPAIRRRIIWLTVTEPMYDESALPAGAIDVPVAAAPGPAHPNFVIPGVVPDDVFPSPIEDFSMSQDEYPQAQPRQSLNPYEGEDFDFEHCFD